MSDSSLQRGRFAQMSSLIITKSNNKYMKHNSNLMRVNRADWICPKTGTTCFNCPRPDCELGAGLE